mmetsp:Transcript_33118/g.99802  ORF Transcript_33118/g.99802 Transcript_33118/m.99802 type:complete len:228 (-) Transcript_33118:209-892(-)
MPEPPTFAQQHSRSPPSTCDRSVWFAFIVAPAPRRRRRDSLIVPSRRGVRTTTAVSAPHPRRRRRRRDQRCPVSFVRWRPDSSRRPGTLRGTWMPGPLAGSPRNTKRCVRPVVRSSAAAEPKSSNIEPRSGGPASPRRADETAKRCPARAGTRAQKLGCADARPFHGSWPLPTSHPAVVRRAVLSLACAQSRARFSPSTGQRTYRPQREIAARRQPSAPKEWTPSTS